MSGLNKGFTLIEIMVVIAVIGILASVAFLTLDSHSVIDDSRKVRAMQQLKNLRRSLALYSFDFSQYPDKLEDLYNNSGGKVYLKQNYIDNKLKKDKTINYQPLNAHQSYKVDVKLDSGIELLLTPEKLKEK